MPPKIDKYRAIILDFDGVLAESNAIKDQAFEMVFADHQQHLPEILKYHRSTTLIRFEKFRYIVETILKKPYTPEVQSQLGKKFSDFCIREVSRCPWVVGAEEFLNEYKGRLPLYLVSINPSDDLHTILKNRKMEEYFKEVYVAEKSKTPQIQDILYKEKILPNQAVFIGDAISDYTSARDAGVDFIGRRSGQDSAFEGVPVFDDFVEIAQYFKGSDVCQTI